MLVPEPWARPFFLWKPMVHMPHLSFLSSFPKSWKDTNSHLSDAMQRRLTSSMKHSNDASDGFRVFKLGLSNFLRWDGNCDRDEDPSQSA